MNITGYGRYPEQICFWHYMALGMAWYGAKYYHGVWKCFAHTFEKLYVVAKNEKMHVNAYTKIASRNRSNSVHLGRTPTKT